MRHEFGNFIRHGGDGAYRLARSGGSIHGRVERLSLKSSFPNYAALRESFMDRLVGAEQANTRLILSVLNPPDAAPRVTEADLPGLSAARNAALQQWDQRLEAIYDAYHTHPQRLRPAREAMEEGLLRACSSLINQIRQQELGIERYVWRSRGDEKVRAVHAANHGQEFRWANPPEDGHPGQAHGCRCVAVPVPPGVVGNVVLADFAPAAGGATLPGSAVGRRLIEGLIARSPAGLAALAALEAGNALQGFTAQAGEQRARAAAGVLGADLGTVEGLAAAITYARALEAASTGGIAGVPKDGPGAEVFAQGMALWAMHDPGAFMTAQGFQAAMRHVIATALPALDEGRLRLRPGTLAEGWVEVFPELSEGERRLGELPGFTADHQRAWILADPALLDDLPLHTGSPPPADPAGNIVSTPVTEDAGPAIVEARKPRDFTTPKGNVIREHGKDLPGEEYMLRKGHSPETIDEIIANPISKVRSSRGDISTGGRQGATIWFGRSGDWVLVNDVTGEVIQANDRFNPRQEPPYQENAKWKNSTSITLLPRQLPAEGPSTSTRRFWLA